MPASREGIAWLRGTSLHVSCVVRIGPLAVHGADKGRKPAEISQGNSTQTPKTSTCGRSSEILE